MKTLIIALAVVLIAYGAYEVARIRGLIAKSRLLVETSKPFARAEGTSSILVIGDSTAVGVGASLTESVPARLANRMNASVENHAHSGATIADIERQLNEVRRDQYDLVLIQGGANDIVGAGSLEETANGLRRILDVTGRKTNRTVILTSGKVGDAPLFPWFVRRYFTNRAAVLRERFSHIAADRGAAYVDLFSAADVFKTDHSRYYASDLFHPSGEGYRIWFEEVEQTIQNRWPELFYEN